MTKNQATRDARDARDAVSIHQQGNQWIVGVYRADARAIHQSTPCSYWQALHNAAQARVDHARRAIDLDPTQYNGGPWTDYLTPHA